MDTIATELKTAHPTKILEWKHEPFEKFLGSFQSDIQYELGITKPDMFTSTFHFSVKVIMTYQHQSNGEVFKAKTESTFDIGYRHDAPTVEFLFDLIDRATFEFAKIFHSKVQGTNLMYHKVLKPKINDLKESIQQVIEYWDGPAKKFKENGGERLSRFKNLPEIPEFKSYNGNNSTVEQKILRKLQTGQNVTCQERRIFEELGAFYDELNMQLAVLDYTSFTSKDIQDFKNYIHYAFNSHCLITNQVTIAGDLYRLIVNESVIKKNEPITDVKFLTYAPLDIVKNNNKYNRASSFNSTLLYLTETVDTALKEIHPPENKIVTIGVWAPKNKKTFTQYPIEHSEDAAKVNREIAQGLQALNLLNQQQDPLLARYMSNYFGLLAREFSKPVAPDNHLEYALPSGNNIISDNSYFTFRTDTEAVLGDKIGSDYEVVQNVDAFAFFDSIVQNYGGLHYESAGSLGYGALTYITAKLPEHIKVGRNDLIDQYLFLTSTHDGTGSITIAFTPVRIYCANTLNAALNNCSNAIKIRHTASATEKLKEAHKMLGLTNQLSTELEAIFNRWARVRITDPELKRLIQLAMVPNKETFELLKAGKDDELSSKFTNVVNNIFEYAQCASTQQETTTKSTLYGFYNSITGYYQNVRSYKDDEAKFKTIMGGTGLQRNQTAFDLCNEFAKHGANTLLLN